MWFDSVLVFILFSKKKNVPTFPKFRLYIVNTHCIKYDKSRFFRKENI